MKKGPHLAQVRSHSRSGPKDRHKSRTAFSHRLQDGRSHRQRLASRSRPQGSRAPVRQHARCATCRRAHRRTHGTTPTHQRLLCRVVVGYPLHAPHPAQQSCVYRRRYPGTRARCWPQCRGLQRREHHAAAALTFPAVAAAGVVHRREKLRCQSPRGRRPLRRDLYRRRLSRVPTQQSILPVRHRIPDLLQLAAIQTYRGWRAQAA